MATWILTYLLSTIGGTHIVVRSDIFKHIRRRFYIFLMRRRRNKYPHRNRKFVYAYNTVLQCSLCFGFHAGYINAVWMYLIYSGVLPFYCIIVNAALCTSILSQITYLLIKKLAY